MWFERGHPRCDTTRQKHTGSDGEWCGTALLEYEFSFTLLSLRNRIPELPDFGSLVGTWDGPPGRLNLENKISDHRVQQTMTRSAMGGLRRYVPALPRMGVESTNEHDAGPPSESSAHAAAEAVHFELRVLIHTGRYLCRHSLRL